MPLIFARDCSFVSANDWVDASVNKISVVGITFISVSAELFFDCSCFAGISVFAKLLKTIRQSANDKAVDCSNSGRLASYRLFLAFCFITN